MTITTAMGSRKEDGGHYPDLLHYITKQVSFVKRKMKRYQGKQINKNKTKYKSAIDLTQCIPGIYNSLIAKTSTDL